MGAAALVDEAAIRNRQEVRKMSILKCLGVASAFLAISGKNDLRGWSFAYSGGSLVRTATRSATSTTRLATW